MTKEHKLSEDLMKNLIEETSEELYEFFSKRVISQLRKIRDENKIERILVEDIIRMYLASIAATAFITIAKLGNQFNASYEDMGMALIASVSSSVLRYSNAHELGGKCVHEEHKNHQDKSE